MRRVDGSGDTARGTFHTAVLPVSAAELLADRSGALYMPDDRTLVVADLHLEKASAFALRGVMLPPYDTRETLDRLAAVIARYRPLRIIALGDSLHDAGAARRLATDARAALRALQAGREWIWVTGNHDPSLPPEVGGQCCERLEIASLVLQHEPSAAPTRSEIAGHLHPAARVALTGAALRRPCFIANAVRVVLPAFGTFTGGLNVLDDAFAPLFEQDAFSVHVLGRDGIYPVARRALCPD